MRRQKKKWTKVTQLAAATDKETRRFIEEQMSETRIFIDMLLRDLAATGYRIHAKDIIGLREQVNWVRSK